MMFLCGVFLTFQGWQLDPILQFGQLLLSLLIIYLLIKDIVINTVYKNR
ncbi:MAG: Ycf66 family protein [Nostoc sp.]